MLVGGGQVGKVGSQGGRGLLAGATAVLDFVNNGLDTNLTFTRPSSGTDFNSGGTLTTAATDEARFDHDPLTLAARGLLMEGGRTNLALYSESLSNWTLVGIQGFGSGSVENSETIQGINFAKIVLGTTNTQHLVSRNITATSGNTYTISGYVKKESKYWQLIGASAIWGLTFYANFDAGDGTFGTVGAGVSNYGVVDCGGMWLVFIAGAATGSATAGINFMVARSKTEARAASYLGDGTTEQSLGGLSCEVGAFPSSYMKTEGSAATRASDLCSTTNLAALGFNEAASTDVVTFMVYGTSGTQKVIQYDDGTTSNRISVEVVSGTLYARVVVGGVDSCALNLGAVSALTTYKVAFVRAADGFAASVNGGTAVTDASGAMPTGITTCRLGGGASAGSELFGWVRKEVLYPSSMADAVGVLSA